jgi:chaperonin cofactor prefoldin
MAARTLEQRVDALELRMSEVEGQVGFLLSLVKQLRIDVLRFEENTIERFDRIEGKVDRLEGIVIGLTGKVDRLEGKVDRLETSLVSLDHKVDALPRALAEMLDERVKRR